MAYMIDTEFLPEHEVIIECSKQNVNIPSQDCMRIDDALIDFHFIRQSKRGAIAALPLTFGGFAMCSGEFRNLAEDFELGVHQFFKVDVRWPDGISTGEQLYLMNILCCFDAIDFDSSPDVSIEYSKSGRPYAALRSLDEPRISVGKELISGHHLWRGRNFSGNRNSVFVFDEFHGEIVKRNLLGIRACYLIEIQLDQKIWVKS